MKFKFEEDLKTWKNRRRFLRRKLWDLLLAGKVDGPGDNGFKVIAEGEDALKYMAQNEQRHIKAFPDDVKSSPRYFNYRWDGEVTWDTFIVQYKGWENLPSQSAILRVPKNLKKPTAAVMCFHGHMLGCLIGKEVVGYLAEPLASKGYVTLAPDAAAWGDRRDTEYEEADIRDLKGNGFISERRLHCALSLEGRTLIGVMTWEHMRGVDLLQSLDYVDSKKIGCLGMSMGGQQSFYLSMMDDRIACGVEACGVSNLKLMAERRTLNAMVNFVPHILRYTDYPEMGALIAPRPFLCLDAANDVWFPLDGIKPIGRKMREVYKLYNASNKFKQHIHSGEHVFAEEHVALGFEWFDRWLMNS